MCKFLIFWWHNIFKNINKNFTCRWRLVQAAFPHIMHCCAALLYRRKDRMLNQLGTTETKLLYTLHWIIVDAIEECSDAEAEKGIFHPPSHYLFPISTIQVYIIYSNSLEFM